MKINTWIAFVICSLTLFACQPEPTQTKAVPDSAKEEVQKNQTNKSGLSDLDLKDVSANFYLRYLGSEKKLKAEATFLAGKKSIELPKGVKLGKKNLAFRKGVGKNSFYILEENDDFNKNYSFNYQIPNQIPAEQSFALSSLVLQPIKDLVYKKNGLLIKWNGEAIKKDESLVFLIIDEKKKAASIDIPGPTKNSSYKLAPKELEKLSSGRAEFYMVKKKTHSSEKSGHKVNGSIEYYSNTIAINLR